MSIEEQVFYKVSEIFGVKTIISEEHGLVRISGSYDACVDAVRTIVNCMSSAQVEQIDLFATPSTQAITSIQRNFLLDVIKHQEFWSEVEDQTSTRIEPVDMRKTGTHTKIDVYHLPTDTKSLAGVKTRVFQLQKLLSLRPLAWSSFPQPGVTKASLVPISNSPSMTLMERHLDWYRWRDRRPLEIGYTDVPSIVNQGGIIFDKLMAFWSNRSIESVRTAHGEFSRNKYWARRPQTLLTATLGQLGHAMAPIERDAIQKRLDHEASTSEPKDCGLSRVKYTESVFRHRRIISPAIPHLFSLLNTSIQDQSTLSNNFKIILAPRIVLSTTSVDIDQIPVLELEANIDETSKTTKLQSVRLLIHRQYVDLALPRQNSDVRFDAETFMLGAVDSFDPAILQFFEMSKLDIWGAGHFETPPKLILTVPKAACQLMNQLESLATSSMTSSTGLVGEPVQSNPLEKGDPSVTTTGSITKGMDVKHSSTSLSRMSHPVVDSISDQIEEDDLIGESVSRVDQGLRTASSNEAETKRSTDLQDPTTVPIESPEDHNVDQATNKGNQDINTEGHSIQVEYVFDSLMICSKLQSLYQGFPLSSTTIEAGQVGGKREEVKFEIPGIADELMNVRGKDIDQKREKMFKSYFMTFFGTISELISRLPR